MKQLIRLVDLLKALIYYVFMYPVYKLRFKTIGSRTRILNPLRIEGAWNIALGHRITIGRHTWLAAKPLAGKDASLEIMDGAAIGNFNHIYATGKIVIGKKVLTADKVYISDNLHQYEVIDMAIMDQPVKQLKPVNIGDGTWIGEHACIIGANIGKNCVIGANSVVTHDVPDYSVVVGIPGRVIKKFCFTDKKWKKVDSNLNFINEK